MLAIILLIVPIQLLTSRFLLFDVTGGDFVKGGQDLVKAERSALKDACGHKACGTFFELTTVSSEVRWVKVGCVSNDSALRSFFSRTVGSWEEAEATEGRERRPRPPD